jgi:hypothetical protein
MDQGIGFGGDYGLVSAQAFQSELQETEIGQVRQCNFFSVKVCRRFHWDDEISLSS